RRAWPYPSRRPRRRRGRRRRRMWRPPASSESPVPPSSSRRSGPDVTGDGTLSLDRHRMPPATQEYSSVQVGVKPAGEGGAVLAAAVAAGIVLRAGLADDRERGGDRADGHDLLALHLPSDPTPWFRWPPGRRTWRTASGTRA